ncbi:hypothetical protein [Hymenobacter coccineus]|uniref:hypothetical protein n=1 Tax=Hymenobacter coccineus TaxID=1908235 RepID=UPI0009F43C22|nr:hypothetical protein [Hymenobacter coccineus]
MRNSLLAAGWLLLGGSGGALAQTNPRPLTLDEYTKAKAFQIKDLDAESYVKFDNAYILDRYEARKPYFITGDDGLKKRIDLYKLVAKTGMQEIGTMVFYTTETGKRYQALLPDFTADGKVWEKYFEDIHAIDKQEKNFVLKLSYVLSKEMSYQQFKNLNQGKDLHAEAGTYGSDICFPGHQLVALADGSHRPLHAIQPGDQILTLDPVTHQPASAEVQELVAHAAQNYALTRLDVVAVRAQVGPNATHAHLTSQVLEATPNHPLPTRTGPKPAGEVALGDEILCLNAATGLYEPHTVLRTREYAGGVQPVYNLVASGNSFLLNGVLVLQK